MSLTREQEAVVGHTKGTMAVNGAAGTGKTTAIRHRYLALVGAGVTPSRVLVLGRDRGAADRFVDALLPSLAGGFDDLAITTFPGLAFDILRRAGIELRLVPGRERWAVMGQLLADEANSGHAAELWPTLHPYLGRIAFVDEVATASARLLAGGGDAGQAGASWCEVAAFVKRFGTWLQERGLIDFPLLMDRAAQIQDVGGRWQHVLVDDFEAASAPAVSLLSVVTSGSDSVVVCGAIGADLASRRADPRHFVAFTANADVRVAFTATLRPPAARSLVRCHHPAVEPDAVARVLNRAAHAGVPWSAMAVLVRRPRLRARAIARALARQDIPVAPVLRSLDEEPVVAALIDLLRWAGGDESAADRLLTSALSGLEPHQVEQVRREARAAGQPIAEHAALQPLLRLRQALAAKSLTESPAELAGRAFRSALAYLVVEPGMSDAVPSDGIHDDERALDAVVAFLSELESFGDRHPSARLADYLATLDAPDDGPDPWLAAPTAPAGPNAVTITSVAASAGQEWHTVVVAGCVEGELPAWPRTGGLLDPAQLDEVELSVFERYRRALAYERGLFDMAVSRASGRVVATAGPEPGVLVSRFVDDWPPDEDVGDRPTPEPRQVKAKMLSETGSDVPVWPDGTLNLSATKLATYADCPLKFAFSYALGVRDEGNAWANLGTLFHAIVAEFLRPGEPDRSWERLITISEDRWTDDVARYRPQRDEVRRDLYDMLERWFRSEIGTAGGPDVIAVEYPFRVQVGQHQVRGTIDRVDRVDRGLAILDYKTGRKMAKPADVVEDVQLATYHLAATRDARLAADGPPVRLVLRYVRTGEDREQPITEGHAEHTEARIAAAAERIVEEAFDPVVGADCDHCAFHRLCPLQVEGREVGAP